MRRIVGARFPHALEHRSRYVMIAGRGCLAISADMSPGSADRQRHSCRTRMIDMGAFGCRPGRVCAAARRAPECASGPRSWRGVTLNGDGFVAVRVMPRAVQRLLVGSVAVPGSSGESAARVGLPERRSSGYCSLAAWYCSSVTGSSHVVPSPPGMSSSMARWHMKFPAAAPYQCSWPGGVYIFGPGKVRAARCRPAWWRSGCRGRCLDKCRRSGLRRCSHARWRRSGNSRRRGSRCRGRAARRARRRRRRR
jgi:hypothetical protein